MEIMQREQKHSFNYTIVPTMFDKRTKASLMAYRRLQELYPENIWNGVIPIDTNFRNASQIQRVPSDYASSSRGVSAYRSLLNCLLKLPSQRA